MEKERIIEVIQQSGSILLPTDEEQEPTHLLRYGKNQLLELRGVITRIEVQLISRLPAYV